MRNCSKIGLSPKRFNDPVLAASLLLFRFWRRVSSPPGQRIVLRLVPAFIATHVEQGGANTTTTRANAACRSSVTASLGQEAGSPM